MECIGVHDVLPMNMVSMAIRTTIGKLIEQRITIQQHFQPINPIHDKCL